MRRKVKINLLLALALCLLFALPVSAAQNGSLLIKNITAPAVVYRVADASGALSEGFAGSGLGVLSENTADAAQAKQLQTYAKDHSLAGEEKTPDSAGQVFYSGLTEGYYLVCSTAQPGEFAPFLLRIPMTAGNKVIYDVQAEPKADAPEDPDAPLTPPPLVPQIPQTGYIQWPKYLLLTLGVLFIAAGLLEIFKAREKQNG